MLLKKTKKALAIFLERTFAWVLWVISSQIGKRDTISLSFLLLLFKCIAEDASGLLRYIYVNILKAVIIIEAILVLTQYGYEEDARHAYYLDNRWGD